MYLSDLCSAKNAVFTGFVRFPQLYPPKTKTPLDDKVIAPNAGNKVIAKKHTQTHAWVYLSIAIYSDITYLIHTSTGLPA